ncbi:hypothetical protein [Luteirhabdus pelagi]|uniref:hypothetical protein n=1 Tax=Luteirhabdus pelagi TaxID=2792783 RepID=UPI00193ABEB0|nr:hypothetical protein [Luteirhabdus pelagi]
MKLLQLALLFIATSHLFAQDCVIPNGNFEDWSGDDPTNWMSTNIAGVDGGANAQTGYEWRNVFMAPGKVGFGLHLKNASVLDFIKEKKPQEFARLPEYVKEQLRKSSFSASIQSCQGDCDAAVMAQNEVFMRQNIFFDLPEIPKALCGYYKANLKEGDKLWVFPYMAMENDMPAGGVKPSETASVIFENTTDWKPFRIPLSTIEDRQPSKMLLYIQMVGAGFPVTPPYGMDAITLAQQFPSTDGSEIFIDELCFCEGEAVINEDTTAGTGQ